MYTAFKVIFWWSFLGILPWQIFCMRPWIKTHKHEVWKSDVVNGFICSPLVGVLAFIMYKTFKATCQCKTIITYQKNEFCKDIHCDCYASNTISCSNYCSNSAYEFHNWLREHNFKIVKDGE